MDPIYSSTFDPSALTVNELVGILGKHAVDLPAARQKKDFYVALFKKTVQANAKRYIAQQVKVKASGTGIIHVAADGSESIQRPDGSLAPHPRRIPEPSSTSSSSSSFTLQLRDTPRRRRPTDAENTDTAQTPINIETSLAKLSIQPPALVPAPPRTLPRPQPLSKRPGNSTSSGSTSPSTSAHSQADRDLVTLVTPVSAVPGMVATTVRVQKVAAGQGDTKTRATGTVQTGKATPTVPYSKTGARVVGGRAQGPLIPSLGTAQRAVTSTSTAGNGTTPTSRVVPRRVSTAVRETTTAASTVPLPVVSLPVPVPAPATVRARTTSPFTDDNSFQSSAVDLDPVVDIGDRFRRRKSSVGVRGKSMARAAEVVEMHEVDAMDVDVDVDVDVDIDTPARTQDNHTHRAQTRKTKTTPRPVDFSNPDTAAEWTPPGTPPSKRSDDTDADAEVEVVLGKMGTPVVVEMHPTPKRWNLTWGAVTVLAVVAVAVAVVGYAGHAGFDVDGYVEMEYVRDSVTALKAQVLAWTVEVGEVDWKRHVEGVVDGVKANAQVAWGWADGKIDDVVVVARGVVDGLPPIPMPAIPDLAQVHGTVISHLAAACIKAQAMRAGAWEGFISGIAWVERETDTVTTYMRAEAGKMDLLAFTLDSLGTTPTMDELATWPPHPLAIALLVLAALSLTVVLILRTTSTSAARSRAIAPAASKAARVAVEVLRAHVGPLDSEYLRSKVVARTRGLGDGEDGELKGVDGTGKATRAGDDYHGAWEADVWEAAKLQMRKQETVKEGEEDRLGRTWEYIGNDRAIAPPETPPAFRKVSGVTGRPSMVGVGVLGSGRRV